MCAKLNSYTTLISGVLGVFSHFTPTLFAFHQVPVFVCIKYASRSYQDHLHSMRVGPKECDLVQLIVPGFVTSKLQLIVGLERLGL